MLRCVMGWRSRLAFAFAIASLSSSLLLAFTTDAEARRRAKRQAAYSPPYAAMVVDAKTGRILHNTNADALRHPASVTKVMTLYLLFEQIERGRFSLDTPLRVSANASSQAPSKLGLKPGETIEVEDAIKALVTKSANDVAVVVAENVAGSETAFAEQMTRKARSLGMSRTTFVNASGLPDTEQVTTARDLITLGRAVHDRFPKHYAYFGTRNFNYDGANYRNHNKLLGRVEGIDGIKTGYTRMSGFNLLTSAKLDGRHIFAVVLGGKSGRSRDAIMATLVETNLDNASAGPRTAPMVAELRERDTVREVAESRSEPRPVAEPRALEPKIASEPKAIAATAEPPTRPTQPLTTASIAPVPPSRPAPKALDTTQIRPVVATATDTSTTPSSQPSMMRWVVGPQPAPQRDINPAIRAYAPVERQAEIIRPPVDVKQPMADIRPPARPDAAHGSAKNEARLAETRTLETRAIPEARSEIQKRPAPAPAQPPVAAPAHNSNERWVIQLGAAESEEKAQEILTRARSKAKSLLASAAPRTERISKNGTTLFRARFAGFDSDDAQSACKILKRDGFACFATRG